MNAPDHLPPGPPASFMGAQVADSDGTLLGIVAQVWTDQSTGQVNWVAVTDGPHAATTSLIPAAGAVQSGPGRLQVAFPASLVLAAPRPPSAGPWTPGQAEALLAHYWPPTAPRTPAPADQAPGGMTRSEERLRVDVVSVPYARAVLRIETTTEQVMVPATITRQHARLEMRELPAAGVADVGHPIAPTAVTGSPWVTLFSEEPVVTTRLVPVERVRLDVHRVTTQQAVTEVLGREEVVVEHLTATQVKPPVPEAARTT